MISQTFYRFRNLKIYKIVNGILFRESLNQIIFVFVNPLPEIRGHTDIKRSVSLAGQDINVVLHTSLFYGFPLGNYGNDLLCHARRLSVGYPSPCDINPMDSRQETAGRTAFVIPEIVCRVSKSL